MKISFPFKYSKKKKTSEIIINPTEFEECHPKIVKIWSWKKMKKIAYVIHYSDRKYNLEKLE